MDEPSVGDMIATFRNVAIAYPRQTSALQLLRIYAAYPL